MRRRRYAIHTMTDFEDFAGHTSGVAEEADLAAWDVRPIDGKLERVAAEFSEEEAKLDIERKADALLVGADFFEGGSAKDFQSALGVIGGHAAHDGDEGGEDAAGEVALERALDGAAEHFDPTGEEGIGCGDLGRAKKTLCSQDFGGTHSTVGISKGKEVGITRMIPSPQDGSAFSGVTRSEEGIQKNWATARLFLLHGVNQCLQALTLRRSRAVIRNEDKKSLGQGALHGIEKGFEASGVVVMRNNEKGFQVSSRRLTTEATEITEGKTCGSRFPITLQVGGIFTHRQGRSGEQFLSARRGFWSERLWAQRCGFGGWMARQGLEGKEGFREEMR